MGKIGRSRTSLNDSENWWRSPVKTFSYQWSWRGLITPPARMWRLMMNVTLAICGVHGMRIHVAGWLSPSAWLSWTNVTYGTSPTGLGAASTPSA